MSSLCNDSFRIKYVFARADDASHSGKVVTGRLLKSAVFSANNKDTTFSALILRSAVIVFVAMNCPGSFNKFCSGVGYPFSVASRLRTVRAIGRLQVIAGQYREGAVITADNDHFLPAAVVNAPAVVVSIPMHRSRTFDELCRCEFSNHYGAIRIRNPGQYMCRRKLTAS